VDDEEDPTIACPSATTLETNLGLATAAATYAAPEARDNVDAQPSITCSVALGSPVALGTRSVACVASDAAANSAMCLFNLTVVDRELPSIACPPEKRVGNDVGEPGAVLVLGNVSTADNDGVRRIGFEPASRSFFPLGSTRVIATAEDNSGNQRSCEFAVTVEDREAPRFLNCPEAILNGTTAPGEGFGFPTWNNPLAGDNSGTASVLCNLSSGDQLFLGSHVGSCVAEDAAGNRALCTFTVQVLDNEAPQLSCPEPLALVNDPSLGNTTVQVWYPRPATTDNSGESPALLCNVLNGSWLDVGFHTISCAARDAAGNQADCSIEVVIEDIRAPVMTCPADVVTALPATESSVAATWPPATAAQRGNGLAVPVNCTRQSGEAFAWGTHVVRCTAVVGSLPTGTCFFEVQVRDLTPPRVVSCPTSASFPTSVGTADAALPVAYPAGVDNSGLNVTVLCNVGTDHTFPLGATEARCELRDGAGNRAFCNWTVTVEDREPPAIACPVSKAGILARNASSMVLEFAPPQARDNAGQVGTVCNRSSGESFAWGNNVVQCTATDAVGLTASCRFVLTVSDEEAPRIACPGDVDVRADAGRRSTAVVYALPQAADNVGVASVVCDAALGTQLAVGNTTVVCQARDLEGNADQCRFAVRVRDNTPPTLRCPAVFQVPSSVGGGNGTSAVANYLPAEVSDDSGNEGLDVHYSVPSGSRFPLGSTTITVVARDGEGNTASCTLVVEVQDRTAPVLACFAAQQVTALPGQAYGLARVPVAAVAVSDNSGEGLVVQCSASNSSRLPLGSNVVTCEATDSSGNTGSCQSVVVVVDREAPQLSCPAYNHTIPQGVAQGPLFYPRPRVQDNSGQASVTCTPALNTLVGTGNSTVTCTAKDAAANEQQCTFTVQTSEGHVDCQGEWAAWSNCSACPERESTRAFTVLLAPTVGGRACPAPETRACPVKVACTAFEVRLTFKNLSAAAAGVLPGVLAQELAAALERYLAGLGFVDGAAVVAVAREDAAVLTAQADSSWTFAVAVAQNGFLSQRARLQAVFTILAQEEQEQQKLLAEAGEGPSGAFVGMEFASASLSADDAASSGRSGTSSVGLVAGVCAVLVVVVVAVIAVVLHRRRASSKASGTAVPQQARSTVAFENPLYEREERGGLDAQDTAEGLYSATDGLYTEAPLAQKHNPVYVDEEEGRRDGTGYLAVPEQVMEPTVMEDVDTGFDEEFPEGGMDEGAGGYLDVGADDDEDPQFGF
jgi:hypothetical protein